MSSDEPPSSHTDTENLVAFLKIGVDIPIHLYSLYSDLKSYWKRVFASQPEVLEYWTELIERHGGFWRVYLSA